MASDQINLLSDQLRQLQRQVDLINYRLTSLELWRSGKPEAAVQPTYEAEKPVEQPVQQPSIPPPMASQPVVPPPIIRQPLDVVQQRLNQIQAPPQPVAITAKDTEYVIGAQLLPKIGAVLVLLGVLFFVAWGYSSGWITPVMVFTGEILFCLAFIGVGQRRRNEREQFGQILTGIGSCGLYLSIAGAHLVQDLFGGNVMVVAFMALSFANLFYGLASKSKAFLAIGIIGGLAAALMPLKEQKTILNAILTLAIVAPAALVAARRKWADMSIVLWLASIASLTPLLVSSVDWQIRVSVLYLASLAGIVAYLSAMEDWTFDPESILGPVLLFATGLIGFAVQHDRIGALHLLLLGGTGALASFAAHTKARPKMLLTAIAIPATIAPFCFTPMECLWLFIGLTLASAASAIATKSKIASAFAGIDFLLGIATYSFVESWNPLARGPESWILVGLIVAGIGSAIAAVKSGGSAEAFTMGVMAVTLPLFGRLGVVAVTGTSFSHVAEFSAAQALALFALAAVAITARTRWVSAMAAMWISFGIAALAYMYAASFTDVSNGQDAGLLLVLAVTALIGLPVATSTSPADFRKSISGSTGILIGFIAMRLAYVLATMPQSHAVPIAAIALTASLYGVGASVWAIWRKSEPGIVVSWTMLAACVATYGQALDREITRIQEIWILAGLLAVLTAAGLSLSVVRKQLAELGQLLTACAAIVGGFLVMRLAYVYSGDSLVWVALSAAGYSVGGSILAGLRKSTPAIAVSWTHFASAGIVYLTAPSGKLSVPIEMPIITGLLVAFIAASAATSILARRQHQAWHAIALLGWIVFSRWVDVAMTWSGTELHNSSTLTVAWIVYALVLISLGFGMKVRELRLWSFAVMFATVTKILLVDLAHTSVPFRVGVLLGLGLLMLGGGYWYIRGKDDALTSRTSPQ